MEVPENENREAYLQLIESHKIIGKRFTDTKRIDARGGGGAFSILFTAYDLLTKQRVALKFYDPAQNPNMERLNRFHRECKILNILRGEPNILECLNGLCLFPITFKDELTGIKTIHKFAYIPIKLAKWNIEQYIYSEHSDPLRSLLYFREMCKGVARIHSRKIYHRDLKPSNFLIFNKHDVRLSDFGCAKPLDGSVPDIREQYKEPVGDVRYISPELICQIGISDEFSPCADIFSLGAILFEMFTKRVLTSSVYNKEFLIKMGRLQNYLSIVLRRDQIEVYAGVIDAIASSVTFPDIFSFNDFVPKCIKLKLDSLYKDLSMINFTKRLRNFSHIFQQLNICILTLRNEVKYLKWLQRKKQIRIKRVAKLKKFLGGS